MTTTLIELEAELAGEERAVRHLIGERAALTSQIKRAQARERLLAAQIHHVTTSRHPAVKPGPAVLPSGSRFPDVSAFQPNVEWAAIRTAASVRVGRLAVVKVTEGAGFTDHFGAARWRAMAANRFPHRGGYAFLHPSVSPVEQASHFLAVLHADGVEVRPSDVVVADLEVSDGQPSQTVRACARAFGQELAKHVPARRWLYSGGPFVREFGVTLAGYHAHWLPAYVGDPRPFYVFGTPIAWQYSDGRLGPTPHVCPGVGPCDMSIIL